MLCSLVAGVAGGSDIVARRQLQVPYKNGATSLHASLPVSPFCGRIKPMTENTTKSKNARPRVSREERAKVYKPNKRQREMAMAYIEVGEKEGAYEKVYGRGNYSDAAFRSRVNRAFDHPAVVALIKEIQKEHFERHKITVDDLLVELEEARRLAKTIVEPKVMISATMGKATILGLDGSRKGDPDPEPAEPIQPVFEVKPPKAEVRVKNAKPKPE